MTITPNRALAMQILNGNSEEQKRILNKEPFVFVYKDKKINIRFIKDSGDECGYDGCPELGVQWGKCWSHAPY